MQRQINPDPPIQIQESKIPFNPPVLTEHVQKQDNTSGPWALIVSRGGDEEVAQILMHEK